MFDTTKYEDLIYDVGMQRGEDTDYYLKKGFRVVAFEADPELADYCRKRFVVEVSSGRLTIVEGAIAPVSKATVTFFKNQKTSQWGTVVEDWASRNESLGAGSDLISVPVTDFVGCLRRYGIPHYLKIDIEGMDLLCVEALASFQQKPDYLSIESEKVSFEALIKELDLLESLGYNGFQAVEQNEVSKQRESNPAQEGRYTGHVFPEGASGLFGADLADRWRTKSQTIRDYRLIFVQYRLFGDYGVLKDSWLGQLLVRTLSRIMGKTVPGWYDTHARHSSFRK